VVGNRPQVCWCRHNSSVGLCTRNLFHFRLSSNSNAPNPGEITHLMSFCLRNLPDETSDVVDEDSELFFDVYSKEFFDVCSDVCFDCETPMSPMFGSFFGVLGLGPKPCK